MKQACFKLIMGVARGSSWALLQSKNTTEGLASLPWQLGIPGSGDALVPISLWSPCSGAGGRSVYRKGLGHPAGPGSLSQQQHSPVLVRTSSCWAALARAWPVDPPSCSWSCTQNGIVLHLSWWREGGRVSLSHPVVFGERLGEVALPDLEGRRLRMDSGDGLQWGLAEKVQPGTFISPGEINMGVRRWSIWAGEACAALGRGQSPSLLWPSGGTAGVAAVFLVTRSDLGLSPDL